MTKQLLATIRPDNTINCLNNILVSLLDSVLSRCYSNFVYCVPIFSHSSFFLSLQSSSLFNLLSFLLLSPSLLAIIFFVQSSLISPCLSFAPCNHLLCPIFSHSSFFQFPLHSLQSSSLSNLLSFLLLSPSLLAIIFFVQSSLIPPSFSFTPCNHLLCPIFSHSSFFLLHSLQSSSLSNLLSFLLLSPSLLVIIFFVQSSLIPPSFFFTPCNHLLCPIFSHSSFFLLHFLQSSSLFNLLSFLLLSPSLLAIISFVQSSLIPPSFSPCNHLLCPIFSHSSFFLLAIIFFVQSSLIPPSFSFTPCNHLLCPIFSHSSFFLLHSL